MILLNYQLIIVQTGLKDSSTTPTRKSARDYMLNVKNKCRTKSCDVKDWKNVGDVRIAWVTHNRWVSQLGKWTNKEAQKVTVQRYKRGRKVTILHSSSQVKYTIPLPAYSWTECVLLGTYYTTEGAYFLKYTILFLVSFSNTITFLYLLVFYTE